MAGTDRGLIIPDWPAPARVKAVSTTRSGGVSQSPYDTLNLGSHVEDDPEAVARNREVLRDKAGLPEAPRWLNQVHGTRIVEADKITGLVDADAVIAATPKTVCAILTADCLPLLFCDDQGRHVAAVHGGWRGLVGGIAEATVAEFARRGVDSSNLLVWLGPAISGRAYEVDEAVTRELEPADKVALTANAQGRWQLDLYGLARQRLSAVGVLSVTGGDRCTFSESEDFFSYRRDGRCGRQATLVWIDSGH